VLFRFFIFTIQGKGPPLLTAGQGLYMSDCGRACSVIMLQIYLAPAGEVCCVRRRVRRVLFGVSRRRPVDGSTPGSSSPPCCCCCWRWCFRSPTFITSSSSSSSSSSSQSYRPIR